MDYRNAVVPAVAGDSATLYVPLELSRASWLVGMHSSGGKPMSIHKLKAGDVPGLMALIDRASDRLRACGAGAVAVVSCYEAGRDGFWIDRALRERAIANLVLDAASIEVPRRQRRAKTDRLDLQGLLRVLQALGRGESDCRVVRVPTPAEEDARRPGRERKTLIEERVRHVNRLKSLCALHGIAEFEPLRGDRRGQFAALRTAGGAALPRHLAEEMTHELDRLELVLDQIAQVEAGRDAQVAAPAAAPDDVAAPPDRGAEAIGLLVKLRSIGNEQATMLAREAFYRDFTNRHQVGAFFGLDGSPWRSGRLDREQGISKAGNWRARVAAIEQALLWVRYQPESELTRWFRARTLQQPPAVKRRMIVALARKLMVALWRYVRYGVVPTGAQLKPDAV
jgi:transposase